MAEPALVGDCVAAMVSSVKLPVTVKCRIGIDEQDPEEALEALTNAVKQAGVDALIVHARKAWLAASHRARTATSLRSTTRASTGSRPPIAISRSCSTAASSISSRP